LSARIPHRNVFNKFGSPGSFAGSPGLSLSLATRGFCRRRVSRILFQTIIPLGDALPRRSSNLPASFGWLTEANLNSLPWRIGPIRSCPLESAKAVPAYLVLLRVGFTMRRSLLSVRCALTAPFHPYLRSLTRPRAVCFLLHWPSLRLEAQIPDVIRHTALRSPDFPPPPDGAGLLKDQAREAAIVQPPANSLYRDGSGAAVFASLRPCVKPQLISTDP